MVFAHKRSLWLLLLLLSVYIFCDTAHKNNFRRKKQWLQHLLSRTKRSPLSEYAIPLDTSLNLGNRGHVDTTATFVPTPRPCPKECNCNYDTINCNDLIASCDECTHWQQIDFNQIQRMKPMSFANFR